jgi:hypothetical protein
MYVRLDVNNLIITNAVNISWSILRHTIVRNVFETTLHLYEAQAVLPG